MLEVTEAELTAWMRDLANQGYQHQDKVVIGSEECLEVTEYLLQECQAAGCTLDLRLQQKSFQTYLQWECRLDRITLEDSGCSQYSGSNASFPSRIEHDVEGGKEDATEEPHS